VNIPKDIKPEDEEFISDELSKLGHAFEIVQAKRCKVVLLGMFYN
jgi:hypothetical protein